VVSERIQLHDQQHQYLILWRGLPYKECTWETASDAVFLALESAQPAIGAPGTVSCRVVS
jgi:hypothetical protein